MFNVIYHLISGHLTCRNKLTKRQSKGHKTWFRNQLSEIWEKQRWYNRCYNWVAMIEADQVTPHTLIIATVLAPHQLITAPGKVDWTALHLTFDQRGFWAAKLFYNMNRHQMIYLIAWKQLILETFNLFLLYQSVILLFFESGYNNWGRTHANPNVY